MLVVSCLYTIIILRVSVSCLYIYNHHLTFGCLMSLYLQSSSYVWLSVSIYSNYLTFGCLMSLYLQSSSYVWLSHVSHIYNHHLTFGCLIYSNYLTFGCLMSLYLQSSSYVSRFFFSSKFSDNVSHHSLSVRSLPGRVGDGRVGVSDMQMHAASGGGVLPQDTNNTKTP